MTNARDDFPTNPNVEAIRQNEYLLPKIRRGTMSDMENVAMGLRNKLTKNGISKKYNISIYKVNNIIDQLREEWRESILDDYHTMVIDELAAINADETDLREMFNAGMYQFKVNPTAVEDKDLVGNMIKIYGAISVAQDKRHSITGIKAPTKHLHADVDNSMISKQNEKYIYIQEPYSDVTIMKNRLQSPIYNVFIDSWDFYPVSIDEILYFYSNYKKSEE